MHLERNNCSLLKFVSLRRSGRDVQNPPHSPAITAHLLFQDMPGDRCAIQGPQCVENGGEEGTPHCGALCEAL